MENPQQQQHHTHFLVGAKNLQDVFDFLHRTLGREPLATINGLIGEVKGVSLGAPNQEKAQENIVPIPQKQTTQPNSKKK